MPPPPSIISRQFTPVDSDGRTLMVLCNHCRTTRVPRNSLVRKENHLRACQAYHISASALQQQQQQNPTATTTTVLGANPVIDDTNAATTTTSHHDVFGTDSPSNSNIGSSNLLANTLTGTEIDVLPLNMLENSISTRANRSKPGNSKEARFAASTEGRQSSASVADDIYSGMPYTCPISYASEPASLRSLITSEESRKRRRETGSPGLPNESATPSRDVPTRAGAKRLKYAEFYLDEEDFDFVSDARGLREERFKEIVERLARLVRLRDTKGS